MTTPAAKLMKASRDGNLALLEEALLTGINVNSGRPADGATALFFAAQNGHLEIVNRLLTVSGIDANKSTQDGTTPLSISIQNGHLEISMRLLNVPGVDINKTANGVTPLCFAVKKRLMEIINRLLEFPDIDVNKAELNAPTPLDAAASGGFLEIVNRLLTIDGIDVNKVAPLHSAAEKGHLEIVNRLLEVPGIDVNKPTINGSIALHGAAQYGHLAIVNRLLEVPRIDVNKKMINGMTSLYLASHSGHLEVVKRLLDVPGIDINATTNAGLTALDIAADRGFQNIVNQLMETLLITGVRNVSGMYLSSKPLIITSLLIHDIPFDISKAYDIFKVLIKNPRSDDEVFMAFAKFFEKIPDINAPFGPESLTPLMYVARSQNHVFADFLIRLGADPSRQIKGLNAAHFAMYFSNFVVTETVNYLCEKLGVTPQKIKEEIEAIKWIGTPPPITDGVKSIYSFVGHGSEHLRKINAVEATATNTYQSRNKILPGRVLLVAAECGAYTLWDDEVKKTIKFGAIDSPEKIAIFQDLFSVDQETVIRSLETIEMMLGMKLHIYRENDQYPEILFSLDDIRKSGLYKNPLIQEDFLQSDDSFVEMPVDIIQHLKNSVYPTAHAVDVWQTLTNREVMSDINKTFKASIGDIMEKVGEGVYIFASCRDASEFRPLRNTAETATKAFPKNILNVIQKYNNLSTRTNVKKRISNARNTIRRFREASVEAQRRYRTPTTGATGGGSAAPTRRRKLRRTRRLQRRKMTTVD